ncbi:uncharacterized protein F5147DRAFT_741881 [Suillus discolor]|uniref:DUF6830 domain-containing protein n=1 Tax=Suillus discolor TaxID=1912936 RepID=A0A9P7FLG3_9AGAM|nr:uncharacterized protein F5147DRAFT_741881 [Suillus discolor]KAG2121046.1 hypothetical protein F5147DRAFT_741881 [Suillus discolor]
MDSLPSFTPWKVSKLEFKGYKTVHPVELIWRDALQVVQQLFSDPMFANHMTFNPYIANVKNQHEYGDYMSANMAWKIQDYLPLGATQVPIILGSDKTPVTRLARGIEMHLVFITISNIDSEVRPKATLRAWRCIAYIPIVKFRIHQEYQSILQARLWHKCMDLIFANLKVAANNGCFMPDPSHYIHHVFTPLVTHMCNLPEATMIAAVSKNSSPLTMAIQADFSDGILNPPHTGNHTLELIVGISQNWMICKKLMTGVQHLAIIASIAGAVPHRFVHAICSLVDFFYLAQNPVHSPQSLQSLVQALSDLHSFKDAIVQAEARKGKKGIKEDFFILKLELLQSFDGTIRKLGTLMQFSADVTERLLITHCKNLFLWTSRQIKDFMEQCVHILNRQESMEIFDLYMLLTSRGASLVNAIHAEDEDVTIANPALSWSIHGPRPVRNHFLKGILSGDALTTFQLNVTPDYKSLSLFDIRTKYALLDFNRALADFICRSSLASGEQSCLDPKSGCFHVWHKFRLQLHSAFQPRIIMPSRVVQAYPPSDNFPLGNCNTVLIDAMANYIAQVRLIFQPTIRRGSKLELPSYLSDPLLYVQFFCFISSPDDCPELAMWTFERAYMQDENGNRHREGAVIRVTDAVANGMSSATCLESYEHFFLNNFADKESYHTFSTEFV